MRSTYRLFPGLFWVLASCTSPEREALSEALCEEEAPPTSQQTEGPQRLNPQKQEPLDVCDYVKLRNTFLARGISHTHVCNLLPDQTIRCWGENKTGALGLGDPAIESIETPDDFMSQAPIALPEKPIDIVAGGGFTCVLLETGDVRCWGDASLGQLGYGDTQNRGDNERPTEIGNVPVGGKVVQLKAFEDRACAILETGGVRCWGSGENGQLGYGNTQNIGDNETPESVGDVPLGEKALQIALGSGHTCVLVESGNVRCWGKGEYGKLGYGNTQNLGDDEPITSEGYVKLGQRATQVATGSLHSCALLEDGQALCWGFAGRHLGYKVKPGDKKKHIGDNETPEKAPRLEAKQKITSLVAFLSVTRVTFEDGTEQGFTSVGGTYAPGFWTKPGLKSYDCK